MNKLWFYSYQINTTSDWPNKILGNAIKCGVANFINLLSVWMTGLLVGSQNTNAPDINISRDEHVHILTHWGRVTNICVSNLTINGSDNGLSLSQCQAIIWTNVGILLIGPLGKNFSLGELLTFSFEKMLLKASSSKWRPCCLGHSVLMH